MGTCHKGKATFSSGLAGFQRSVLQAIVENDALLELDSQSLSHVDALLEQGMPLLGTHTVET